MLNKVIAAILTIGAMLDFEKTQQSPIEKDWIKVRNNRAWLWVQCYKTMLRYMRIE